MTTTPARPRPRARPAARPLSDAEQAAFDADGYLVVADLLPAAEVDAFLDRERRRDPQAGPRGLQSHRVDAAWAAIARHRQVVPKVRQLIAGTPLIVQSMFLAKAPAGGTGIALHQDTHYIRNEPNTLMACWIAFGDTDADNGGLCVVPGSHRLGLLESGQVRESAEHASWEKDYEMSGPDGRAWTEPMHSHDIHAFTRDRVRMLEVPRGGGVFFTSLTVHGSYANRSADRPRLAFATHYVREGTWVYRRDLQGMVPA